MVAECTLHGNPTYLDPTRVSEAFREERVLVARARRGPGEPQSVSWGLAEDRPTVHGPARPERGSGLPAP